MAPKSKKSKHLFANPSKSLRGVDNVIVRATTWVTSCGLQAA